MAWPERMSMTLDDFLRRLPKLELHCHLLGSVRRDTFADLGMSPLANSYVAGDKLEAMVEA